MKQLPIKSSAFRYVEQSFKEWLDVLGYAPSTVYTLPNHIRGLFHFLEQQGKTQLKDITRDQIREYYYNHLKNRSNVRKGGGLSNNHLNKHLQSLYKFCDYLRQSGRLIIPDLGIRMEDQNKEEPTVLTEQEVGQLYKACDQYSENDKTNKAEWFYPAIALRDKAMLAVYYGCGLRRNEALHLELGDVLWDKQLLLVRKGKNHKERFVPISKSGLKYLEAWVYDSRPMFLRNEKEETLFISERGKAISGQMMYLRLNLLVERTENLVLKQKNPGLHTLRHSIATHLLANGMKLEKIKDFLGHSSLESTQIYTHLIENENTE
jgi:integrase/recombinase XerD